MFCLLALSACEKTNPAYCDRDNECVTGRCDPVTHACTEPGDMSVVGGEDMSDSDMPSICNPACSGKTPACENGMCVSCATTAIPEATCAAIDTMRAHCMLTGPDTGSCVNCRDSADCPDPLKRHCDATTYTCRGCIADSECASLVCDMTPGSATLGRCVPANSVFYVNGNAGCNDSNDATTPAMAVCKISVGVAKAIGAGGTVVRIANISGGMTYNTENLEIDKNITLVGETGTTIRPAGTDNPALNIKGNGVVVLRNLILRDGAGNKGDGIKCESGNPRVTVLQCVITDNNRFGIDGNSCTHVTVDRTWIGPYPPLATGANDAGGIRVTENFRITNSVIVKNNGRGVFVESPNTSMRELIANTIVGQRDPGVATAGVDCPLVNPPTIVGNILHDNRNSVALSETNCVTSYTATDDGTDGAKATNVSLALTAPGFAGANDYHLAAGSPCRDKGTTTGAPSYDYEGKPRPDATMMKVDIGAYEAQ
jgi:hypothetical protein